MTNSQATNPLTYDPQWSQAATRKDAGLAAWEPLHHNSQSSFARLAPRGAAIGRQTVVPPLGLPTPSIVHHDHQMTPHSKGWGNPLGTSCAETLAGRQGRGRVLTVGVPRFFSQTGDAFSAYDYCPSLTRRLLLSERSRHFFRVRVGSSRRSAINLKSLERHFQCVTQRYPGHSFDPSRLRSVDAGSIDPDANQLVDDAARWSKALWSKTHAGMGDTQEAAMFRAAERYGVEPGTFWALRYRKPKDILASIYFKLKAAYEAEYERQEAMLAHQLEITKALPITPARQRLIDEAEAVLGRAKTSD